MYLIRIAAIGMFSFVYFALLNTAIPAVIFFAIILSFIDNCHVRPERRGVMPRPDCSVKLQTPRPTAETDQSKLH
jgi:hypothetical protein